MIITPTDRGATIAGVGFASLCWASLFKLNHVAELLHLGRLINQEKIFNWIGGSYKNQALSLLITEIINYGTHGITSVTSVMFALGSTVVNAFMILLFIPMRFKFRREKGVVSL